MLIRKIKPRLKWIEINCSQDRIRTCNSPLCVHRELRYHPPPDCNLDINLNDQKRNI